MSKHHKGFLPAVDVEEFLFWVSNVKQLSWMPGRGLWEMARIDIPNHGWSIISRDKFNVMGVSPEVKELVIEWRASKSSRSDTEMLDWLIESGASVINTNDPDGMRYQLYWCNVTGDDFQAEWYSTPREAIMAQMRAEST